MFKQLFEKQQLTCKIHVFGYFTESIYENYEGSTTKKEPKIKPGRNNTRFNSYKQQVLRAFKAVNNLVLEIGRLLHTVTGKLLTDIR